MDSLEVMLKSLYRDKMVMKNYFSLEAPTKEMNNLVNTVIHDFENLGESFYGPRVAYSVQSYIIEYLEMVIKDFVTFKDTDVCFQTLGLINSLQYVDAGHIFDSSFVLKFKYVQTNAQFSKEAIALYMPSILNSASQYFIDYEIARALKDRNTLECTNALTTSETIPTLTAMICAYNASDSRKTKMFFSELKDSIIKYIEIYHKINNIGDLNDNISTDEITAGAEAMRTYLISFYYSLALFNIYMICPEIILEGISAILKGELTTDEFIKQIENSFGTSLNAYYDDGIHEFKLLLTKK